MRKIHISPPSAEQRALLAHRLHKLYALLSSRCAIFAQHAWSISSFRWIYVFFLFSSLLVAVSADDYVSLSSRRSNNDFDGRRGKVGQASKSETLFTKIEFKLPWVQLNHLHNNQACLGFRFCYLIAVDFLSDMKRLFGRLLSAFMPLGSLLNNTWSELHDSGNRSRRDSATYFSTSSFWVSRTLFFDTATKSNKFVDFFLSNTARV